MTPAQLQEAMRASRSKKLQIGQVLVMSGYMTSRDLQLVLEAQSMLRDRTIDLNLAVQCIKVARKIGGNFSDVLEDYDATAAQRARTGKLGELLLEAGLVGEEDLSEAMERSVNTGMPLGRMLVLNRILPSEVLQRALEVQVRLRDEVVTREEAILELRQAAGLEGDAPKTVIEEKKKPVVRLGELLVMAGILNENDVMDALEWGLANQQPIGVVLVSQELITKELLDAALFFQNCVRDGKMDAMKGCELLSEVFSTGATPEEVLADATPSRTRQEPEFPPISYQHLLTMARVVTDEEIENAFDLEKQSAALIGKVLVLTGLIDVPTLQNTLRCFQMVAKGWLTPDDAIASLDYCLHQNADMPMAFEQALRELKWNPDTGLKMRGETGATESSTNIPKLKLPEPKVEPAESASTEDKKQDLPPAAPEEADDVAPAELTSEINPEEVNGKEDLVDLETTVDQPVERPIEKVAVGAAKEALLEAEAEPVAELKSAEPAAVNSKTEPVSKSETSDKLNGKSESDLKKAEPESVKSEPAEAVRQPEKQTANAAAASDKSSEKRSSGGGGSSGPSLASALKSLYDEDADEDEVPDAQVVTPDSGGGLKKLLDNLISVSDDKEEEDVQELTSDPLVETKDTAESKPEVVETPEAVAESKVEEKTESKPEVVETPEPVEAKQTESKLEVAETQAAAEAKEVEAKEESKPVQAEPKPEKETASAEAQKTDAVAADTSAASEDSLDEIVKAAKSATEAAELAAVEDVAAMSAEQLLVEIMKSAQNPALKPATNKRGGRFSETILPEDAKAKQLAKLVGKESSKDLADKLTFDQSEGDENPEAVDTAFGRLAETYFEQGNYKEAQVIYERMLVHRLNEVGPESPLLVEDYNNLAMTLCVQGRFDKAEPFMKRAVHLYETAAKQDPVEFADYLHSLGTILYKLEKHKDAEEVMLRVVSIRRESLDQDHEDIGRALADYAKVLKKLGKDESAEAIYKKAREILKKHKDS